MRLEHLTVVILGSILGVMHLDQLNWWRFLTVFLLIDLIGYIPGAIAYYRHGGGRILPIYHYLYNITHSYLTAGLIIGIWAFFLGGQLEWAMLAFPIHLSGDRGIFGNVYKPLSLPFEPK
jgi:hypothetical protein